jgi:hypothetical protein
MKENDRDLYYLHELPDYKVASDSADVRGWEVKDVDNRRVGKVDNLLVSKKDKRVVYLDVEVDKSVIEDGYKTYRVPADEGVHGFSNKDGEDHIIIPIEVAKLDEDHENVITPEVDYQTFTAASRFKKGTPMNRALELMILGSYLPKRVTGEAAERRH